MLRKHGFRPTDKELAQMIKNVDKNHQDGGGIDFDEFIELLVNHGRNLEDDIAKSFRMFDLDGDGNRIEGEAEGGDLPTKTDLCRANHGGGAPDHDEQPG